MSKNHFFSSVALLLVVFIVIPSVFLVVPQRVHAQVPDFEMNPAVVGPTPVTAAETTLTAVQTILGNVYKYTSMVADYANWINTYVLQPLAFVMSGNLMKMLTASVVKFVIGTANGTGAPQFVASVQKSMQTLSDIKAGAYLNQMRLTGSPFASSIAAALGLNYSYGSSLGGYWAANMCTLRNSSPNIAAYLNGNWSQGGVAAWLALTTQVQNNPYTLYQNSQAQLANVIGPGAGGATGARLSELSWGQGMMSWCGTSDAATYTQNAASSAYQACIAQCSNTEANPGGYTAACANHCGEAFTQNKGIVAGGGINPGDPCTKTDGSGESGTIQTPGSVIKATLDKVLGGQQDKLVQMGQISSQITGILGNIGTVINTINLASSILGGGSSGGLLNAGSSGGALSTFGAPTQSNITTGYGTSQSSITSSANQSNADIAATHPADAGAANANAIAAGAAAGAVAAYPGSTDSSATTTLIQNAQKRVNNYQTAWGSIGISAQDAKTALTTMVATCQSINTTEAGLASTAIINEVNPIIVQVTSANSVVTAAQAKITLVQNESTTASTYPADVQVLTTMAPTSSDVSAAVSSAQSANGYGVTVNATNPLLVSGGSIVDQMSKLVSQAGQLQQTVCTSYTGGGA